jgi:hypothetical protein
VSTIAQRDRGPRGADDVSEEEGEDGARRQEAVGDRTDPSAQRPEREGRDDHQPTGH